MKANPRDFWNSLPESIKSFISEHCFKNYKVGFVGGVVRDFILEGRISYDIDVELRPLDRVFDMGSFFNQLEKLYTCSFNKEFQIISLSLEDYSLELGFPRIEQFRDEKGHKNFDFSFSDGHAAEFLRRDFTINAMMFEFSNDSEFEFHDPTGGLDDLRNRKLKPCSADFQLDPVRLLRAFRFELSKNFEISTELQSALKKMSFEGVSPHYFVKEAEKSHKPLSFFKKLGLLKVNEVNSLYDSNRFSIAESIGRSIDLGEERKKLISFLKLSTKHILEFGQVQKELANNFELYRKLAQKNLEKDELEFILSYLGIDYKAYDLGLIFNNQKSYSLGDVPLEQRAQEKFKLLLAEAKK